MVLTSSANHNYPVTEMMNVLLVVAAACLVFWIAAVVRDRRAGRGIDYGVGGIASTIGLICFMGAGALQSNSAFFIPVLGAALIATLLSFYVTYRSVSRRR